MGLIEEFFTDVDCAWRWPEPQPIPLHIIGSSALMLQTSYLRGTDDGDVWDVLDLTEERANHLREIAGRSSAIFTRRRMYIDIVGNGVPLIPYPLRFEPIAALNANLEHFAVRALNVVDVVVSKLKRFHANDRADINAVIGLELVPYQELKARFPAAMDRVTDEDAKPAYWKHFNQVERDQFGVEETPPDET